MHELIKDPGFDLNRTNDYTLSIQVSLDGFSFCVVHKADDRLMAIKNTPVTISEEKFLPRRFSEWIKSEEILNKTFGSVRIIFHTERFTLVPREIFDREKQYALFNLLFLKREEMQILNNTIENLNARLLYSIPADMLVEFDKYNEHYTLSHPVPLLISKGDLLFPGKEKGVLLFFSKNNFILLLFDEGKPLLVNAFPYKHINDIVYFVLAVLRQNQIRPVDCNLLLSGITPAEKEIPDMLKNYFNQIDTPVPSINRDPETFDLPLHQYITLF